MDRDLYRLVYCSRNEIKGTGAEIAAAQLDLLEAARARNRSLDITGCLVCQSGIFAQVLEGPRESVEHIFSRVQQDERNSGVTACLRGPEAERDFPRWAMAFADGEVPGESSLPQVAFDAVFASREGAGESLLALLRTLFPREEDLLF